MDELTGLFLTAAEEGDFAKLQQMYANNPELLMVFIKLLQYLF